MLLAGCVEVTFPEPMPFNRRDRSCFPKNIQGVWHAKGESDNLEDSIAIHSQYIDFGEKPLVLSDNSVLRKFNGYFVFSMSEDDDEGRWRVYFAKHNSSVLSLYEFDGGNDAKIDFLKLNLLPKAPIESFWDALWLGIRPFLCFIA